MGVLMWDFCILRFGCIHVTSKGREELDEKEKDHEF